MEDLKKKTRIGVIGGSKPDKTSYQLAFQVGKLIGEKGGILVCGGLGGIMEASARGAKQTGSLTIGILPGSQISDANPYIDLPVATGLGYARNSLVAMNAEVLIAINGRYGTLTEIAYGNIYGKKVIGLGTWPVEGVLKAGSAEEAVELAFKFARRK
ncbi:MAG: TIGR00725 family protein [Candidatus Aminicenantales bacterium]